MFSSIFYLLKTIVLPLYWLGIQKFWHSVFGVALLLLCYKGGRSTAVVRALCYDSRTRCIAVAAHAENAAKALAFVRQGKAKWAFGVWHMKRIIAYYQYEKPRRLRNEPAFGVIMM